MPNTRKMTEVFVQPGEYFIGDETHRIGTLLGSCVSITIWLPQKRVGALSHFLLPTRGGNRTQHADGRYGDEAVWLMLRDLMKHKVPPSQYQAKIFGGGDMFPGHRRRKGEPSVGEKNGLAARKMLDANSIPVISECLFGEGYRRIIFDVSSGHVWSRHTPILDALPVRAAHMA